MADALSADELCHSHQTWRLHLRCVVPHCTTWGSWVPLQLCFLNEFSLFRRADLPGSVNLAAAVIGVEELCKGETTSLLVNDAIHMEIQQSPSSLVLETTNKACFSLCFRPSPLLSTSLSTSSFSESTIIVTVRFSVRADDKDRVPRRVLPLDWRLQLVNGEKNRADDDKADGDGDGDVGIDLTNGTGSLPLHLLRRRTIELDGMRPFSVVECEEDDIAGKVWDGGLAMVQYLHIVEGERLKGLTVLELGSGTGLVGVCCALHGANIVMTDMIGATRLATYNALINKAQISEAGGECEVKEHNWGTDHRGLRSNTERGDECFHLLVMSDVVYDPLGYDPLLTSLVALLGRGNRAIMAHRSRHPEERKFFEAAEAKLQFTRVAFAFQELPYPCNDVSLFEIRCRN